MSFERVLQVWALGCMLLRFRASGLRLLVLVLARLVGALSNVNGWPSVLGLFHPFFPFLWRLNINIPTSIKFRNLGSTFDLRELQEGLASVHVR